MAAFRQQSIRKIVSLFEYIIRYGVLNYNISFDFPVGYDLGGVLTSSKRDTEHKKSKEAHCLYPGDLYPFTRRPLFVIVDSDNSFVFQHIPRYFGQPLVTLMSPQDTPPAFQGNHRQRKSKYQFQFINACSKCVSCFNNTEITL